MVTTILKTSELFPDASPDNIRLVTSQILRQVTSACIELVASLMPYHAVSSALCFQI